MKTRENKIMVTIVYFTLLKTIIFEHIYEKKSTHSLFGAWSFLLIHIHFTPSEGPKDFVN